jgi:two-component system, LytTR family, sensor kinase
MQQAPEFSTLKIIPVTLQILVENAIKHNITYEDSPLKIHIYTSEGYLVVQNNHQPKTRVEGSNKKGLNNLRDLYYYTTGKEAVIENTNGSFTVKIPLIAA